MIDLNSEQVIAVEKCISFLRQKKEKMMVIEGSAGTGKTTCIQTVVKEFPELNFVLTAPTNKATRVLKEVALKEDAGKVSCMTIYSLLGLKVVKDSEFIRVEPLGDSEITNYDVVVVDEGSMANAKLMGYLYEASINCKAKIIFMLDPYQLPPVGEDQSEALAIPNKVVLEKVERHDNQILTFATHLRECVKTNTLPKFRADNDDDGGVYCMDHRRLRKHIQKGYTSERYENDPNSCKTIAWRNAAVADFNEFIRDAVYGERASEMFVENERVVATHPIPSMGGEDNEFAMTTDEEGTVASVEIIQHPMFNEFTVYHLQIEGQFRTSWTDAFVIHPDSSNAYNRKLSELSESARSKKMPWASFWSLKNEFMHDVRPCHAITAHRSQGSTYRSVFVDAEDILYNRNQSEALRCLYVACTRPTDILVLKTR